MSSSSVVHETEVSVQQKIKQLARIQGFHVTDFSQGYRPGGKRHGSTRQTPGVPDLYLTHAGRSFRVWVEVKGPKGTLRQSQVKWHLAVGSAGGRIWTCSSVSEFAAFLSSYGFEVTP